MTCLKIGFDMKLSNRNLEYDTYFDKYRNKKRIGSKIINIAINLFSIIKIRARGRKTPPPPAERSVYM